MHKETEVNIIIYSAYEINQYYLDYSFLKYTGMVLRYICIFDYISISIIMINEY